MSIPTIPVYVINLDHRADRWELIKKQCFSCGIQAIRVSAVKASPGWHGCGLSHKKVAEMAEKAGHMWYVVLEDDATFSINDWNNFMAIVPFLWKNQDKWDVFTGGTGIPTHLELINNNPILYHIKGPCTHFLLIKQNAYKAVKNWNTECRHFDHYLKENTKMVGTYPFISMQLANPSDINIGDPVYELENGQKVIKSYLDSKLNSTN